MNWFQILVFIVSICCITLLVGYLVHREVEGTGPCPSCSQAENAQKNKIEITVDESSDEESDSDSE